MANTAEGNASRLTPFAIFQNVCYTPLLLSCYKIRQEEAGEEEGREEKKIEERMELKR